MAFKETVRSMRAYLLIAGAIGGFQDATILAESDAEPFIVAYGVIGLAVSAAFIYCGVRLRSLLATNPRLIQRTLYATIGVIALSAALLLVAEISETGPWIHLGIGVAVALYLLANVKRLSAEVQGKNIADIFD